MAKRKISDDQNNTALIKKKKHSKQLNKSSDNVDDDTENGELEAAPAVPEKQIEGEELIDGEFTEVEFNVLINDEKYILLAVEKFIKSAKDFPNKVKYDIVAGFCQHGGGCSQIFNVLLQKRPPHQIGLIFQLLECILIRIADDLTSFKKISQEIISQLLTNHLNCINYIFTRSKTSIPKIAALSLLSTIISQTGRAVSTILSQVKMQEIAELLTMDKNCSQDVKLAITHFFMAFLITGNNAIIKQFLSLPGRIFQSIFPGLMYEKISTIQLIIPIIHEKIVKNPGLMKTLKLRIFSTDVLVQLCQLYNWKGPQSKTTIGDKPKKGGKRKNFAKLEILADVEEDTDDKKFIRNLVHPLMMELCCSPKLGIIFKEISTGNNTKVENDTLYNFIVHIKQPQIEGNLQELLLGILKGSPDLTSKYIMTVNHLFVPRPTTNWKLCIQFLQKVFTVTDDSLLQFILQQNSSIEKQISRCLNCIFPPKDIAVTQALKKKQPASVFEENILMQFMQCILRSCIHVVNLYDQLNYQNSRRLQFKHLLQQHMYKYLPDAKTLTVHWKSSSNKEKKEDNSDISSDLPKPSQIERMSTLLDTILLHQDFFQSFDSTWETILSIILSTVMELSDENSSSSSSSGSSSEELTCLYSKVLSILSKVDARIIPWTTKINDKCLSFIVLHMFTMIPPENTKQFTEIQKLTVKVLVKMGNFEGKEDELLIWLNHLNDKKQSQSEILAFLDTIFQSIIASPHLFIDLILESVSSTQISTSTQKQDKNNIDELLKSLRKSTVNSTIPPFSGKLKSKPVTDTNNRLPFSVLVTACLQCVKDEKVSCSDVIHEYLSVVLIDILFTQFQPDSFCRVISSYEKITSDWSLFKYIKLLNHQAPATVSKKKSMLSAISNCRDFSSSLKNCLLHGMRSLVYSETCEQLLKQVKSVSLGETVLTTKHLLFCLQHVCSSNIENKDFEKIVNTTFELLITLLTSEIKSDEDGVAIKLQMCRTILTHPCVIDNFIPTSNDPHQNRKKIISRKLSELVATMNSQNLTLNKDFTDPYINKIKHSLKNPDDNIESLFDLIEPFRVSMDTGLIVEMVELLLKLLRERQQQNTEITSIKTLIVDLLQCLLNDRSSQISNPLPFSLGAMNNFLELSSAESCDDNLLRVIDKLVVVFPNYCLRVDEKLFIELLELSAESAIRMNIVKTVIKQSPKCLESVSNWIKLNNLKTSNKLKYLHLIDTYLKLVSRDTTCRKTVEETVVVLMNSFWKTLFKQLIKDELKENVKLKIDILVSLIPHLIEDDLACVMKSIVESCGKISPVSDQHLLVFHAVLRRCITLNSSVIISELPQLFTSLSNIVKTYSKREEHPISLSDVLNSLKEVVKDFASEDELWTALENNWMKIFRSCCRKYYHSPQMLSLIREIVVKLYSTDSDKTPSVKTMYEMLMSHSQFHQIIINENTHIAKGDLIELLTQLVILDPSCCHSDHVASLLAAYNATLSSSDVKLIYLLRLYETAPVDMSSYRPFFWGQKAMDHHFTRKSVGPSLRTEPKMEDVMLCLDTEKVLKSALKFPLTRKLLALSTADNEKHITEENKDIYDPCFLLPLFGYLLRPDAVVNCEMFVRRNCLSYIFTALSSYDATMRGAAYYLLMNLITHLEGARLFSRKQELLVLLKCVKNSMLRANYQMPCVVSIFLAKAANILVEPGDAMYKNVMDFILAQPVIDTKKVPEFFKLFCSSSLNFDYDRNWMLVLLCDGLRLADDYTMYQKKRIFDLMQTFYDSPLSSEATRVKVLKVLRAATKIQSVVFDLVKKHSVLTWILGTSKQSGRSQELLDCYIELLDNIWIVMKSALKEDPPKIRSLFVHELLMICFTLIDQFSDQYNPVKYQQYLSILSESMIQCMNCKLNCTLPVNQFMKLFKIWANSTSDELVINAVDLLSTQYTSNNINNISNIDKPCVDNSNCQQMSVSLFIIISQHLTDFNDFKTDDLSMVQCSLLMLRWMTNDSNNGAIVKYMENMKVENFIDNLLMYYIGLVCSLLAISDTERLRHFVGSLSNYDSKLWCLKKFENIISIAFSTKDENTLNDCCKLLFDVCNEGLD